MSQCLGIHGEPNPFYPICHPSSTHSTPNVGHQSNFKINGNSENKPTASTSRLLWCAETAHSELRLTGQHIMLQSLVILMQKSKNKAIQLSYRSLLVYSSDDRFVMIDLAKPHLSAGGNTPDRQVKCNLVFPLHTEEVICPHTLHWGRTSLQSFVGGSRISEQQLQH